MGQQERRYTTNRHAPAAQWVLLGGLSQRERDYSMCYCSWSVIVLSLCQQMGYLLRSWPPRDKGKYANREKHQPNNQEYPTSIEDMPLCHLLLLFEYWCNKPGFNGRIKK